MVVVRTERGDEMFMTWFARNAQQVLDLDAVELLPAAAQRTAAGAASRAADEGRHEPGPEALWNESWYFDAVSDDAALGVYVRLGRLPNQGVASTRPASAAPDARRSCSSTPPRRCPTPATTCAGDRDAAC